MVSKQYNKLTETDKKRVIDILSEELPWVSFDIRESDGWITVTGESGSDADFIELSCGGLFDLVSRLLTNSRNSS